MPHRETRFTLSTDAGVAWKRVVGPGSSATAPLIAGATLRLDSRFPDGGVATQTLVVREEMATILIAPNIAAEAEVAEKMMRAVALLERAGKKPGPEVFDEIAMRSALVPARVLLRPPPELEFTVVTSDDSNGHATVRIKNSGRDSWLIERAELTEFPDRTCGEHAWLDPYATYDVKLASFICPFPIPAARATRRLTLCRRRECESTRFEVSFPFDAKPGSVGVLFPERWADHLAIKWAYEPAGGVLLTWGAESRCACMGQIFGRERLELTPVDAPFGTVFWGVPTDGGRPIPLQNGSRIGDFPNE